MVLRRKCVEELERALDKVTNWPILGLFPECRCRCACNLILDMFSFLSNYFTVAGTSLDELYSFYYYIISALILYIHRAGVH